ncbi:MAG: competence protein [Brumimicrobium sp.]|nr:competence protein [Brumimicrobium sp.]
MAFDELRDNVDDIQEEVKSYIDKNIAYYKLLGFKVVTKTTVMFVKYTLILLSFALVLIFGSIAAGLAIGEALDSNVLGFLIIAGIYLFIGIILLILNYKVVEGPLLRKFSDIFFKEE